MAGREQNREGPGPSAGGLGSGCQEMVQIPSPLVLLFLLLAQLRPPASLGQPGLHRAHSGRFTATEGSRKEAELTEAIPAQDSYPPAKEAVF